MIQILAWLIVVSFLILVVMPALFSSSSASYVDIVKGSAALVAIFTGFTLVFLVVIWALGVLFS